MSHKVRNRFTREKEWFKSIHQIDPDPRTGGGPLGICENDLERPHASAIWYDEKRGITRLATHDIHGVSLIDDHAREHEICPGSGKHTEITTDGFLSV